MGSPMIMRYPEMLELRHLRELNLKAASAAFRMAERLTSLHFSDN